MTMVGSADEARARFDAATEAHLHGELAPGVAMTSVTAGEWLMAQDGLWRANQRSPQLEIGKLATDQELQAIADLDAVLGPPLEHRLLLHAGDQLIGAYWGQQEPFGRYYMVSSVIDPGWQRRGLYRALLARVIAAVTAAGFREISSRHRADNNPIIIPKLQAGFAIAAFEITPRWGILVHLRRYTSAGLQLAFEHRIDGANAAELRARGVEVP